MDESTEIYYTDVVYEPDYNEADSTIPASPDNKKDGGDKLKRDYTNQKKMTQKLRVWIDQDQLIRIAKSTKKIRPGSLGLGVRRLKHDINALAIINPAIERKIIGPSGRMKKADKQKLKEFRDYAFGEDEETQHLQAPWRVLEDVIDTDAANDYVDEEKENGDMFVYRRPGLDLHPATGSSAFAIRSSKPYQTAEEIMEATATIKKIDATINMLKLQEVDNYVNPIFKEPFEFEEPNDSDFTCARIRSLTKLVKRRIINVDFNFAPSTSSYYGQDRVSEFARMNVDVNPDFTLHSDIRPEVLIQREMAQRSRIIGNGIIDYIASAANNIDFGRKKAAENEIIKLNETRNKSEGDNFADNIKMIIKRVKPITHGQKNEEPPTYQITKKNDKNADKKKEKTENVKVQPRKSAAPGDSKANAKRPRKSKEGSTGPKPKKTKTSKKQRQ